MIDREQHQWRAGGTLRDERDIWSFEYAPERIWELACLRVIRFTVIADMVKMMSR
jgi:hypothetical protein